MLRPSPNQRAHHQFHQILPKSLRFGALSVALALTCVLTGTTEANPASRPFPSASLTSVTKLAQADQPLVKKVASAGFTVSDMDRSIDFFETVLSFRKISDLEVTGTDYERLQGVFGLRMRVVQLQLGQDIIELTEYLTPQGKPIPVDSRSNDLWFQHVAIVVSDMDKAYQHLRRHKIRHASTGPQTLPDYITAAAGIKAFYFRDPDGHYLEVIYFPPGKGNPRWQQPTGQLFLGIDHTAIAVADTDSSLKFYRDGLGLSVAGESENYGTEQEHLNNVFGARLRISGLKAPTGYGVEFLEYLAPPGGRPRPQDAQANDLLHWQTTLVVTNATLAAQRLRAGGYQFVSPGVVTLDGQLGFRKAFLVKDPDGHVIRIIE